MRQFVGIKQIVYGSSILGFFGNFMNLLFWDHGSSYYAAQGIKYQTNPILTSIILKDAGHGSGKPTYKLFNLESDMLTFLYRSLSIEIDIENGIKY